MDDDDGRLLARIQEGDGESFGVLYDRTRGWLLSFVIVPRVGRDRADDVLAETYRTALAKIRTFEWRGTALLHWLASIAKNKCLETVRKDGRSARREESLPELLFEVADDAPSREAEMIRTETLAALKGRVEKTMADLPPRYAEALRLRLLEGRDRQTCAAALAVSVATFDVVLYRATQAFSKRWTGTGAARESRTGGRDVA